METVSRVSLGKKYLDALDILTTVGVFVDDGSSLEGSITRWVGAGPDVGTHTAGLAIRGSSKVGVVGARTVLGVQDNKVIALTALTTVVDLEVSGLFVETEHVVQVMADIRGVEELGNRGINVGLGWVHVW